MTEPYSTMQTNYGVPQIPTNHPIPTYAPPETSAENAFEKEFWLKTLSSVQQDSFDFKVHQLPLARIKKVMKSDEDMISAEAPILFSKGCDVFIAELTQRAWKHAVDNKRRTLQRSDIAAAISKSDMFDFLIDIVPREEQIRQTKPEKPSLEYRAGTQPNYPNFNYCIPQGHYGLNEQVSMDNLQQAQLALQQQQQQQQHINPHTHQPMYMPHQLLNHPMYRQPGQSEQQPEHQNYAIQNHSAPNGSSQPS
ncbi:transcription factor CBF [Phycomyces blakesleeanus NRRL 1555(-)]|uniref:Transcription factor CBF n=1 Tax=Phycomyces blakesleeanus (strain ATCC 8743b / DSM 1359 / FGSC 10004 / NBRC 33097 / NRRL 1555) TaxID=763407 RepID=A0A167NHA6_PHYB8|nr:transcription factor CBF [Phycomyces blakesleeanus NRRL 1555(-)]OAD75898.1 transcription factor CBF [Phycomyces blakesleeanus NRRL 1555(-)]|eukprot:XP_018293938.1 transcription factor CBF [Phycomyces blakesleeanus NRRL 1555(-)]